MQILGTCSLCRGPVVVPDVWYGLYPPIPTCSNCGATAKRNFGPEIPMEPKHPVLDQPYYVPPLTVPEIQPWPDLTNPIQTITVTFKE